MHDVEREGDVAQERADAGAETVGCHSARSQPYYRRENQEDAYRLENAIQYDAAGSVLITTKCTFYIRHVEEQEQDDGADPECTFHLDLDAMENTG